MWTWPKWIGFFVLVGLVVGNSHPSWSKGSKGEPHPATSLEEALVKGAAGVDLRYRYEYVTDKGFPQNSYASTLRTVIYYQTGAWKRFDLYLEAQDVTNVGAAFYNAPPGNPQPDRPLVPDPSNTTMNQVYLRYARDTFYLKAGRHEINLDDMRFIGSVPWRQNHQSFTALRFFTDGIKNINFQYAYLDRVYRVVATSQAMQSHLFNLQWDTKKLGKLTGYTYILDFNDAPALSTVSYGAEFLGIQPVGDEGRVVYEVEYARQDNLSDNPNTVRADYWHLKAGGGVKNVDLVLGWEQLGGKPGDGRFITSLATLHKFNGWADKFVVTPTNGLQDYYVHLLWKPGRFTTMARYHNFRAASLDSRYGDEWDFLLGYNTSWNQLFAVKTALYRADTFSTSADRVWFWTTYSF